MHKIEEEKKRLLDYLEANPESSLAFIKEALGVFEWVISKAICEEWNVDIEDAQALRTKLTKLNRDKPCPNCKELLKECACFRNKCWKCKKPVGNITFTVCDDCWEK